MQRQVSSTLGRYRADLRSVIGSSATAYGYMLTVWSTGMVLSYTYGQPSPLLVFSFFGGAVLAFALVGILAFGGVLGGLLVEVVTHLVLATTTSAWTAGTILALFGFHAIVWGTVSASLRQELVREKLMGHVNSVYLLFDAGSASIGALLGGLIASGFGLTTPFWLAAASVAAWVAVVWRALGDRAVDAARASANNP